MEGSVHHLAGGIRRLDGLLTECGEPIEYDLISHGLRLRDLGTERFTWRDLLVIVKQSPRSSALSRAKFGVDAEWGLAEQLLAAVADEVRWLHWSKTKDAGTSRNPEPEPIPRPGVKPKKQTLKGDVMEIDEFERRYAQRRAQQTKQ